MGHVIKGGGVAVTGQEQSLLYNKDNIQPAKSKLFPVVLVTQKENITSLTVSFNYYRATRSHGRSHDATAVPRGPHSWESSQRPQAPPRPPLQARRYSSRVGHGARHRASTAHGHAARKRKFPHRRSTPKTGQSEYSSPATANDTYSTIQWAPTSTAVRKWPTRKPDRIGTALKQCPTRSERGYYLISSVHCAACFRTAVLLFKPTKARKGDHSSAFGVVTKSSQRAVYKRLS